MTLTLLSAADALRNRVVLVVLNAKLLTPVVPVFTATAPVESVTESDAVVLDTGGITVTPTLPDGIVIDVAVVFTVTN